MNQCAATGYTCSDYAPVGHGLFGDLACFRGNNAGYLAVRMRRISSESGEPLPSTFKKRTAFRSSIGSGAVDFRKEAEDAIACRFAYFRNRISIAWALGRLGHIALAEGHYRRAAALQRETLSMMRELGNQNAVASNLIHIAAIAACEGPAARDAALRLRRGGEGPPDPAARLAL